MGWSNQQINIRTNLASFSCTAFWPSSISCKFSCWLLIIYFTVLSLYVSVWTKYWCWIIIHGAFNKFPASFVQAFKIDVDSWKFSMLLLFILWDDWPIFMISGSNEQLQQQLEYTLLKPDCHSWWISKNRYVAKVSPCSTPATISK